MSLNSSASLGGQDTAESLPLLLALEDAPVLFQSRAKVKDKLRSSIVRWRLDATLSKQSWPRLGLHRYTLACVTEPALEETSMTNV